MMGNISGDEYLRQVRGAKGSSLNEVLMRSTYFEACQLNSLFLEPVERH
jgi:hypothetical protein